MTKLFVLLPCIREASHGNKLHNGIWLCRSFIDNIMENRSLGNTSINSGIFQCWLDFNELGTNYYTGTPLIKLFVNISGFEFLIRAN